MLDVDIIEINDEQSHNAKLLASSLSEVQIRKRGMIDMLGIQCAINYLRSKKFKIDTKRSVYKIPVLFEEFKITDIYFGNYRIDVITLYKEKSVKIPRIHVDMDILPHFYFIVQIGAKIKEAKMIGFIDAKNIRACSHDSKFYYPTLDMIMDLKQFSSIARRSIPSKTLLGKHVDCMGLFLKFIDNDLSSVYKRQLIQHLMNCDSCRANFIDAMEFEKLALNLRYYPLLMKKYDSRVPINDTKSADGEVNLSNLEEKLNKIEIREKLASQTTRDYSGIKQKQIAQIPKVPQNPQRLQTIKQPVRRMSSIELKQEIQRQKALGNYRSSQIKSYDTSERVNQNVSKKVIDTIFNEIPKVELPSIKTIISAKNKRLILMVFAMFFILASFTVISFKGSSDIIEQNEQMNTGANLEAFGDNFDSGLSDEIGDYDYQSSNHQAQLIPKDSTPSSIDNFTIMQPVSTQPTYAPTVSNISWEAPESLVKKAEYTKFLQLIGKNVKLNVQNDLLLVSDIPTNKIAKVDIRIESSGDVQFIKISKSSGSEAIDNSILKVVGDTLKYMKPPGHGIISKKVDVTLVVELN